MHIFNKALIYHPKSKPKSHQILLFNAIFLKRR